MVDPRGNRIRFTALGPLRAWDVDIELSLGPVQQRVVLAVLLIHANRHIGRQQLIDAIWGTNAPAYAVNLLQKNISGIRRVLERGRPAVQLTWSDAGYRLAVPAGALDLHEVDDLIDRARSGRAAGDLPIAAEALQTAVALWRGPAFEGLSSPLLDAERDRLAERRITVLEERLDVELALGRSADLIAELRQLVEENPLRERLREQLMVALYRCGRQAEALEVFREARRYLGDELGVDPGPALRALQQQILAADPKLDGPRLPGPPVPTPPVLTPVPAQLPRSLPDFVGRETDLGVLDSLLDLEWAADGRAIDIVTISGMAGVGKTALAAHWAHRARARFPDGQLYVNLRGFDLRGSAIDPAEVIRAFLDGLGMPSQRVPSNPESQAALYRSLLADRRVLILLDNARDDEQVRPLLPGGSGCLVLVTSRSELPGLVAYEGAQPLALGLLSVPESRRLLARRLGEARTAAEPEAVNDIITSCARLPLALTIAAARAAVHPGFSLEALAGELREVRGRLDAFDGGDRSTDVRAVFSWSYEALTPEAARLFRLLGLHPGPDLSASAAASLAGTPRSALRRALAHLVRAHLLTERLPGRFALHDLLRLYAAELAEEHDSPAERTAALRRLANHYERTAARAQELLNPYHDDPMPPADPEPGVTVDELGTHEQAFAWFDQERAVLLAVIRRAAESPGARSRQLICSLGPFLEYQGDWQEWRVALEACRRNADPVDEARLVRLLGRVNVRLGRFAEAERFLYEALALYCGMGDLVGQAQTHRDLCWHHDREGRHREALAHAEQSLELFRAAGHRSGEGRSLNAIGWFHIALGDYARGVADCSAALDLQCEINDRYGQAETWDSLGYAFRHLDRAIEAVACYERSLALYRDFGDRYNEADSLAYLGDANLAAGDPRAAGAAWSRALAILDAMHHPEADAVRGKLSALEPSPV
jgi:DNA-binding SARP family transcriptional activator